MWYAAVNLYDYDAMPSDLQVIFQRQWVENEDHSAQVITLFGRTVYCVPYGKGVSDDHWTFIPEYEDEMFKDYIIADIYALS